MRAKFLAVAALGCLAACSTITAITDFTVTQNTVDKAMSAYDSAFLAPAKTYRGLYDANPCTGSDTTTNAKGVCAQRSIVVKLQAADKVVEEALGEVQSKITACKAAGSDGCTGVSALYSTLTTAISAAEKLATQNGVK